MANVNGSIVKKLITDQLAASVTNNVVVDRIVAAEVERRLDRRTDLMVWALDQRDSKSEVLAEIKPASQGFDAEGQEVVGTLFRKDQVESRKQLGYEIGLLDAAIDVQNYDTLSKFSRKGFPSYKDAVAAPVVAA